MLTFFGRGSAFCEEQNSAYFLSDADMILLDCPMSAFQRIKTMDLRNVSRIYVLVTHTHGDHISGIGMLIDYEYFVGNVPVTIVAPSEPVRRDLEYYIKNLEGIRDEWFEMTDVNTLSANWLKTVVPTTHSPELGGKCFGYVLRIEGKTVVYTGDTNTLDPFIPYLQKDSILYTEVSSQKSPIHLSAESARETIKDLENQGVTVFLMHLDDEEKIVKTMNRTQSRPAPLMPAQQDGDLVEDSAMKEVLDISEQLYKEMCSGKKNDHIMLFLYLTELGKVLVGADRASFWKWDKRRKKLWTTSAIGVEKIEIPDDTGLVGKAIKQKKVLVTNDPYNDPDFNPEVDKKTGYLTRHVMVLPVADVNGEAIGAYQLINKIGSQNGFDEKEDIRKLSLAALICGIALESETFLEEAYHDKLTKLKNRMGFYSDFARVYSEYMSPECDKPMSMFICDIDKFKNVNDTYGHNAGDDVLSFMAGILQSSCSAKDMAYRWGGEEFIMIMRDTALAECAQKAEVIRNAVMHTDFPADGKILHCTVSFGCRQFDPKMSIEDNISEADKHLYEAKEGGRNQVRY
ncbi:MAG: diguanylate cyclase [Clostridiales bacterium]|nr:diguanylate cyclase [Clostridiales bacterium]